MSKKYSFILPIEINKEISINNKNNQIPHPKNINENSNPIVLYKNCRNIKTIKINRLNDRNNKIEKNFLNNSNTINSYLSNINTNNTNNNLLTNGDNGIYDIINSLKSPASSANNFSKKLNFKKINDSLNENKKVEINDNYKESKIKNKIEYKIIEEKIRKTQKDMDNVKKNIEKLNKKMIDMKNNLSDLNKKKYENESEIKNLISNKETLEEMYNTEIIFIKNEKNEKMSSKDKNINNININISLEEIKNININIFKLQIKELLKILFKNEIDKNNNINNDLFINSILNLILQEYNNFYHKIVNISKCPNKMIQDFFINISEIILNQNKSRYTISSISSLLHYLIKLNCISQKIENFKNYVKKDYQCKTQEINEQLIELTMSLIIFENQKHEILTLTSKLKEQLKNLEKNENNNEINIKDNNNLKNIIKYNTKKCNIIDNKILKQNNINNVINLNKNNFNKNKKEIKAEEIENKNNDEKIIKNINDYNNISNHNKNGDIEITYINNNLNNEISERDKVKNKIFENYINNGIVLNNLKKKKIKKYKNFNSISDNMSKSKDKIINDKTNYSTSFNYNFNTNFFDLNINKKNITNIKTDRKNILLLKNTFEFNKSYFLLDNANKNINNNINNINRYKRKLNNGNDELNTFNSTKINKIINYENKSLNSKNKKILTNINNYYGKYNTHTLKNKNKMIESKLKPNKSFLMNNESFFTKYQTKKLYNLSNFQKYLAHSFTNSSFYLDKKTKSINNLKNNRTILYNKNIFKSLNRKKNISNLLVNDLDEINYNKRNKSNNINNNIYICKRKKNSSFNINNYYSDNKSLRLSNLDYKQKNLKKKNDNNINENFNINNNKINGFHTTKSDLENQLKIFKQGSMESFCYFKIIDKNINDTNYNPKKYNYLNDCSINPEYFGYYECYISIDVISGCIKISPKLSIDKIKFLPKNNEYISIIINNKGIDFYMNIKLKEIYKVYVEKYMKNIIKIQNILLKYNTNENNIYNEHNNNNNRVNKIFSINKIMNKKEMTQIKIEQNEKIKAALCNFFSFSFSLGDKNNISLSQTKIDLVFINFKQFNIWLNTLSSIVQNNLKSTKINILPNYNSSSIQKLNIKYKTNYKKILNNNSGINHIRIKNRMLSINNIVKTTGILGKKIISFYK